MQRSEVSSFKVYNLQVDKFIRLQIYRMAANEPIQSAVYAAHIFLEKDRCRYLIYQRLIAPLLLFQSHFEHGVFCHFRGEAFVYFFDGYAGEIFLQIFNTSFYQRCRMCIGVVPVFGFADDDQFHWFF